MATESRGPERVYVAVVHDRHMDPEVAVFRDRAKAIDYARRELLQTLRHPNGTSEQYHSEDFTKEHGEIWRIEYNYEEDYAAVFETEIE